MRQRQCDNVKQYSLMQGPEKNGKIPVVRPQCLDGVATINIVKWQLQTTLWPDNMVTLLRQNCCVPSSDHVSLAMVKPVFSWLCQSGHRHISIFISILVFLWFSQSCHGYVSLAMGISVFS